jgi:hypothetical protein
MYGFLVEPQNQDRVGTTVVAKSWLEIGGRPHQVRGVSSGSPQNHWVFWLSHKDKTEDRTAATLGRSD